MSDYSESTELDPTLPQDDLDGIGPGVIMWLLLVVVVAVLVGTRFYEDALERQATHDRMQEACETTGGEFSPSGLGSNTWCIVNGAPYIPDPKLWDPEL